MARVPLEEIAEPVDTTDPATVAQERLLEEEVRQALAGLSPQEALLLRLGFGLGGSYTYNRSEIGRMLRYSDHRVR
jgi:DNA-directed RNA polymerase sigma subunit (sigma70/sigma32)